MSDQGQYDDMEDEELQMALLMSMQEVQPDEAPGSGAAVASVQPPQHSAPAQTAPLSAANNDLASQLQLALQQALAQMAASAAPSATVAASAAAPSAHPAAPQAVAPPAAFSTAAPALTSRQVAQQPQQQQQRQVGPAPTWVAAASIWRRPPTPTTALLPAEKEIWEGPLREALSKALGQDLQPGEAASLVSLEKGERKFNAATADALLNRLVNTGGDPLLALQGCWARSLQLAQHAEQQQQQVLAACLQVLQLRVLKKAVALLANDEDDLFFEGGRFRKGFMNGLESGQILPTFFDGLVLAIESKAESDLWRGVLKDSFKSMKDFDFAHPERHAGAIRRLDVVTQGPAARRLLAIMLLEEAASSQGLPGRVVEESFTLAPLMAVTTLPSLSPTARPGGLAFPAQGCFMQLRGYPRSRGLVGPELNSIRRGLGEVVKAAHEICKRVATLKVPDSPLRGREVWPAWVAAVCGANLARASAGSTDAMLRDARAMYHSSSDGFMCGLLAVALRFCRPFLADAAKKQGALQHLDPAYYTTQAHRVAGVEQERSLAGAMMPAPSGPPAFPYISPERPEAQAPHFVAEMFFLTQRLIRVGLMPAVHKSTALAKMLKQQAGADDDEDEDPANSRGATLEQWLLADSVAAQIMDPEFASDACQFMELQALWLVNLLQQGGDAAKAAFQRIPESVVSDMTGWLSYVIRARGADLFGGMDIGLLMSCLAGLLRHTELVPSPKTHFGIVNLLLSMLGPQLWSRQRPGTRMLAGSHLSAAEGALVSAVLGTGATQTELLPAIMKAYAHADHVVALDVDKDNYDKFGMRHSIDLLLMELWKDPACAASLARVAAQQAAAGGGEELFADFVGAVLNDLLYLLKDSLGRLEDIHALERSMADKAGWAQLSPAEQQDKKRFYQAQQRAAGGFMYQAVSTLRMLNTLTAHPEVQRSFLQQPIAGRAANACVHFLDLLVGPCCSKLAVDRPEQYFFDPDQLLLDTAHLMLRLAERPEFVHAISEVPDYDEGVMRSVLSALESRQLGEYEHRRRLEALMGTVQQLRGGPSPMETEGAAPSQEQGANTSLDLAFPEDPEEVPGVEEVYAAALQDLSVGDFDSTVARAYNRHFAALAEQAAGDTAGKMKALSREMRNLRGRTQLPIYAASSIFVRHDSDRMDKVRALITGPEDTPYYGGCFFFDVYFPQDYPNVPPLMELETTGGGVARFNPNLYADGKVCLSLLGTWHGGHESEKWKPGTSTLFQVLLSIQGMIFIADPYFNEPAYDAMRGTSEGSSSSLKYNSEIWLNNIRYAMLDVLRRPRPGFEEVITTHFRLLRHRIMQQCSQWLQQAAGLDPLFQKRLRDAVLELHGELAKL